MLRHTPGARLQTAVIGGCLLLSGLFASTLQPAIGLLLACYGAALVWFMTTAAAGRDLGPWWVPFVALCLALPAFAVGDVLLFAGLFGHHALLPLAVVLIGSAIAVVALLERRLKARLGYL